jgi:hypothetical protein
MAGNRMHFRFLIVAMVACLLAAPCRADQPKAKGRRPLPPATAKPQPETAPAVPPVALRPEQMPANPPQVSFHDGQLTITAENSTLGDILRAVRNQTSAAVEVPANATERVVGSFGPGPARDVLSSLLNGSHFNYLLLGSATNPDALERVILTVKSPGAGEPAAVTAQAEPPTPPGPAENPEMATEDQPDQPQEATDIFAEDPSTQTDDQAQAPFGQPAANVRTPEQMLQDLQRQQDMQQQLQQRQQQMGINPGMSPRAMPFPNPGAPQPVQPTQPQ